MKNYDSPQPDSISYSAFTKKQRQIWAGQQLYGSLPIYNLPLTFTIQGELKVQHFQNAFQALINSCDVFRTLIEDMNGVPRLKVLSHFPYTMEFCDFSQHPDPEHAAQAWIQPRMQHVFKLNECLFESALIKLAKAKWIWFYNVHHIISDGLTLSLTFQRMSEFYGNSLVEGSKEQVAQPQYQSFVEWEADFFQTGRHQKGKEFWAAKLRQHSEPLQLYGRTMDSQLVPINRVTYPLDGQITQAIYRLASSDLDGGLPKPAAIFEILAAVFMTYLHRISGQRHLSMGIPFHNRPAGPFKTTLGLFVEVAPLCIDIANTETFETLRKKIRREVQAMRRHVRSVPEHTLQHRSYHVMFNYHLGTFPDFFGMPTIMQWHHVGMANVGLNLNVQDFNSSGAFTLDFDINAELFNEKQQHRMLQHTLRVLQAFLKDPSRRLNAFSMLSNEEEHLVLHKFNQPPNRIALNQTNEGLLQTGQCVHHLVEAQTAQTPEAVALVSEDQQLTYAELNVRTNQLAYYLQKHGVGPEVLVGLCVDRSLEMVIGLLGILKAGGAYAPLDPNYPQERLAFIAKDADLRVILTQEKFQEHLSQSGAEQIRLDADWPVIGQEEESTPVSEARADSLAYVIYTSGSTGRPKGVQVTHANVVRLFLATEAWYHFDEKDVWTLFHSYAFDFSVWELWGAFFYGGRVVIVPYDISRSPEEFYKLLVKEQVTILNQTPSAFRQLIRAEDTLGASPHLALRYIIFGGEALDLQSLKPWFERHGDQMPQLVNMYGITETTVHVTHQPLSSGYLASGSVIGRPIPDLQVYILDRNLEPVPIGVPGELYVGGAGVARGYLNRPDLTAERFIAHLFSETSQARLYKTGDRGRFLSDGVIEYLGRMDNQVQLRGFRIELGEIEAVLAQHPMVAGAVAVVREDEPGEKRLVGYVVPAEEPLSPSDLRKFLKQTLPAYMVPAAFVVLEALPLTPSGKLDRRALPAPDGVRPELDAAYQVPRHGVEQTLAQLWKQVLRIDQIGRQDNFFELGGDSILSIQIVAKANQAGLPITPRHLFQYQTIAELAAVVGALEQVTADQGVVTGPLPLSPVQHWFFAQQLEEPNHWNMSWVLEARQSIDREKMGQVVEALLQHHDALRLRFVPHSTGWKQEMGATNEPVPFTVVDLSHLANAEAEAAFTQEADRLQSTLKLTDGPLICVALFQFGEDQADRVLLVIHHLAVDGISWRILLDDLQTAYDQLCVRKSIQLPPKTTSFKVWTERLVEYAQSDTLHEELNYWRAVANTPWTPLPRDVVDGINTVASTQTVSVALGREDTQALLQDIPEVYHTQINDVLLTALVDVLAQWSRQETVCLDLEGHGREELVEGIDLSRTVGWFTSIFPVVLKGGYPAHPGELLKSVKEQLRQIPLRGIGYGLLRYLREDGKIRDQLGERPDPEVAFNYLGQFDQVIPSDGRWRWSGASGGVNRHPRGKQPHLVSINARIMDGVLQVQWSYSEAVHRRETIETLANNYLAALLAIIRHCQLPDAGGYTPSDFPLARVNQADLDKALMGVKTGEGRSALSDLYPLTPLQQGLWFYALLDPASGMYFEQSVLRIEGFLNRDVFLRAWEEVLARHAILRTRIVWEGLEHPLQLVQSTVELPWAEQDWRGSPVNEHQARLLNFLDADRVQGFDLTQAPLMRLTLLQVAETSAILVWSFHHLILDRWSVDVVQQEVWLAYQALVQGRPLQFNSLRPYREYLAWLQDQDLNRAEQYWRHLLRGFTEPTVLGVDQAPSTRVGHQESGYDSEEVTLSEAATTALSRWARQQQLTVNTVVQGALAVLLSRYSGSEDVVFGATVSGRSAGLPGIETMVGLFINTLPVRVQVSPRCSLAEWLRELQEQQVSLREYEYTPLFEIQKWSEVPPEAPLFNALLVFENTPQESDENLIDRAAGLDVQRVAGRRGGETNYSLTVVVVPGRTLQVRFTYNTEHYTAEAITRMVGHFQQLLAGMIGGTQQQQLLGAIPLLREAERQLMLVEWNATATTHPRDVCIHHLFEAQVEQTPDAVALVFGEDALTYDELNTRANHLAHLLHQQYGVGPEVCVGLCMDRSLDMVVGILGILKAGGAYVPLDPAYPPARLAYLLEDAQVQVLLTQERLVESLPQPKKRVICVDTDPACFPSGKATTLDSQAAPGNVAYLIYTSGSTGQPKGVAIEHRSAVALLHWAKEVFGLEELRGVLASTSICFDLSVFELFVPLSGGGTVILAQNVLDLPELPNAEAVTLINTVPSGIAALLRGTALPASVRTVNLAGEPLRPQLVREIEKAGTVEKVYDLYGPSEDTTYSTKALREGEGPEIIGRPIANTQAYLLDQYLGPVPIGVSGEVYLGGEGLARGYYNRFALTAEKFIPDPFAHKRGARLYKTGDVARYLADGTIQYLGRVDHQVKIRGYRIELGEIETTLSQLPGIKESVVVAREDEPGDKRVVAYVVPAEEPLSPSDLRQFLKQTLPEYMVPASFVMLDAVPLTPNGKINRRALPAPAGADRTQGMSYVAPRTPLEHTLVNIWQDVLGLDQVGMHDNFFDLGGHSLLATRVVSRVRQEFHVDLKLMDLFKTPTIAELTKGLEGLLWINAGRPSEDEADLQERDEGIV